MIVSLLALAYSCNNNTGSADAYGNFESQPVMVASQTPGQIVSLHLGEGDALRAGTTVGMIDTMQFHLKQKQLMASTGAVRARIASASAQVRAQEVQLANLQRDLRRSEKLFEDGAATEKQIDDLKGSEKLLKARIEASRSQENAIRAELQTIRAQISQVRDQLSKAAIINPVNGIVLRKYKMQGEIVGSGQVIYKVAAMDTLILRAYISGKQLAGVQTGQQVTVKFDVSDGLAELPGRITWIASEAEFTPKIIQTRDERVNLVYAIKIQVKNDGRLKIGMPGEVQF